MSHRRSINSDAIHQISPNHSGSHQPIEEIIQNFSVEGGRFAEFAPADSICTRLRNERENAVGFGRLDLLSLNPGCEWREWHTGIYSVRRSFFVGCKADLWLYTQSFEAALIDLRLFLYFF